MITINANFTIPSSVQNALIEECNQRMSSLPKGDQYKGALAKGAQPKGTQYKGALAKGIQAQVQW